MRFIPPCGCVDSQWFYWVINLWNKVALILACRVQLPLLTHAHCIHMYSWRKSKGNLEIHCHDWYVKSIFFIMWKSDLFRPFSLNRLMNRKRNFSIFAYLYVSVSVGFERQTLHYTHLQCGHGAHTPHHLYTILWRAVLFAQIYSYMLACCSNPHYLLLLFEFEWREICYEFICH